MLFGARWNLINSFVPSLAMNMNDGLQFTGIISRSVGSIQTPNKSCIQILQWWLELKQRDWSSAIVLLFRNFDCLIRLLDFSSHIFYKYKSLFIPSAIFWNRSFGLKSVQRKNEQKPENDYNKKSEKKRRRRITPLALCVCFGPILLLSFQMDMCNVQRHQCQNCIHHNFIWRILRFWISRWRKWWNLFFSFFSFNSLRLTDAPTPFIKNYQYRLNPIVYNHDEITDGQQKY